MARTALLRSSSPFPQRVAAPPLRKRLRICACVWSPGGARARSPPSGRNASRGPRAATQSEASAAERGRLRGAGRELSGAHGLVGNGAAGTVPLRLQLVSWRAVALSRCDAWNLPLVLIPLRARRKMKVHQLLTKLDDAPWEWGSTGGWSNGMPKFFHGERPCLKAERAVQRARALCSWGTPGGAHI